MAVIEGKSSRRRTRRSLPVVPISGAKRGKHVSLPRDPATVSLRFDDANRLHLLVPQRENDLGDMQSAVLEACAELRVAAELHVERDASGEARGVVTIYDVRGEMHKQLRARVRAKLADRRHAVET